MGNWGTVNFSLCRGSAGSKLTRLALGAALSAGWGGKIFLALLVSGSVALAAETKRVKLPVYPPRIEIFNSAGEPLVTRIPPRLAFQGLTVVVATDENSPTGYATPGNLESAAGQLRDMLPPRFFDRLLWA